MRAPCLIATNPPCTIAERTEISGPFSSSSPSSHKKYLLLRFHHRVLGRMTGWFEWTDVLLLAIIMVVLYLMFLKVRLQRQKRCFLSFRIKPPGSYHLQPQEKPKALPKIELLPLPKRDYTRDELRRCDGKNGSPLLIAIAGDVFDCRCVMDGQRCRQPA